MTDPAPVGGRLPDVTGRRRLRRWSTMALLAILCGTGLFGTGCATNEPAEVSTAPLPQYPTYDGSGLADLSLEPVELSDELIMKEVTRAAVIEDTMIMSGHDQDDKSAVAAVDLRTGEPRWQGAKITDSVDVPSGVATIVTADGWAVDDGRDGLVIEQYYHLPCGDDPCSKSGTGYTPERGLIALSAVDRSVRWSKPILPKLRIEDPEAVKFANLTPMTVAVTSRVIVVNLGGDADQGTEPVPGSGPTRSIGYDPATGKKLWSRDGVLTQQATDDLLLAVEPGETATDTRLLALDPITGETGWRFSEERAGRWAAAAGDLAVARLCTDSCQQVGNALVSTADGSVLTEPPETAAVTVGTGQDGGTVAGWAIQQSDSSHRLDSQASSAAEPATGPESLAEPSTVRAVVDGYLWLAADDQVYAADRTGAERSHPVRGRPQLVDESRLLVDGDRRSETGISLYTWHG